MPRTLKIYLTREAQSSREEVSSLAPTPLVLAEHRLHPGGHSPVSPVPDPLASPGGLFLPGDFEEPGELWVLGKGP